MSRWLRRSGRTVTEGDGAGTPVDDGRVLVVSPHQDDELLSMGSAIIEAVAAGREVSVLLVSRGEASSVRTRNLPVQLGFVPSPHHFSAMRDREFDGAVRAMGATPVIPPYEQRLPDGAASADEVKALVRAHAAPGAAAFTISPHDEHADHRACAQAVQQLRAEGFVSRASYFISPERTDLVPESVHLVKVGLDTPVLRVHQDPYRRRDFENAWWGIGPRSVKESFDHQLFTDPHSYRHD